jgi:leucyl-tRNA synthetase
MDYGTGAVMAVPAHDSRDFAFARKYDLPIEVVIQPAGTDLDPRDMTDAFVDDGIMVHSGPFDGRPNREAMPDIISWFEEKAIGGPRVNYRMRDWLISRQRYWGVPIPIIYDEDNTPHAVPYEDLPVVHPRDVKFSGRGGNPLATNEAFKNAVVPGTGKPGRRETDTMDTFVDSSWYFLRYISPRDTDRPFDSDLVNFALPVDTYIGGIEHAILHLLYSRFFTKVIHDLGLISFDEPFEKLFCQGMVCRNAFHADYYRLKSDPGAPPARPDQVKTLEDCIVRISDGQEVVREQVWLPEEQVDQEAMKRSSDGWPVVAEMAKMSKSKLNGISPDLVVDTYGADALHAYILFMGPADKDMVYEETGLVGIYRFLNRLWSNMRIWIPMARDAAPELPPREQLGEDDKIIRAKTHEAVRRITDIMEGSFNYNVAVSQLMELHNILRDHYENAHPSVLREGVQTLIRMQALFTPHLGEELWLEMGLPFSVFRAPWPVFDSDALIADTVEIVVQINGKLRDRVQVAADLGPEDLEHEILSSPKVSNQIEGKTIVKIIQAETRQGRLFNIVVR